MTPEIKKALDLALEALESERPYLGPMPSKTVKAITAIKQAQTQTVQEPLPDAVQWYGGVKSDDELFPPTASVKQESKHNPLWLATHPDMLATAPEKGNT
jgi:hypothetical protein